MDLVEKIVELESDVRYQELAGPDEPEFHYEPGRIPVLLSAPHGGVHTRNGSIKEEDDYTAGLARLVGRLTGAHVLYVRRKSLVDPNWDFGVPFKSRLADITRAVGIRFVCDLHGAAHRRQFGFALGTLSGRSCPEQRLAIIGALEAAGFWQMGQGLNRLDVDERFTANGKAGQETVTRFVWEKLGVPAAQFEINASLRVARQRSDASARQLHLATADGLARVVQALVTVVRAVA